ncbi:MAG: glycosyltransferase family 2 protein [Candidatus Planktophila sp.]
MTSPSAPLSASPGISVILPVLNEQAHLEDSVRAILSQKYLGKIEVILALGPSRDLTNQIAEQLAAEDSRIILINNPSGRTAAGLNLALNASTQEIVVRVDAHAEIPNDYLEIVVDSLRDSGAVNVGGVMGAEGITSFEKAVAAAMRSPLGVGGSKFHIGGKPGFVDTVYLGAFIRQAVVEAGGFDERFIRAQDWELNYRLRQNGGKIYFDPRLHVTYRPRPNLRRLARQYFEYGRWRRVIARKYPETINYRYLAPPLALIGTAISLIAGTVIDSSLYLPAATYITFIAITPLFISKDLNHYPLLLFILPTMHFSWGFGFLTSPRKLVPESLR